MSTAELAAEPTAAASPPPPASRMVSAGLEASLEQFSDPQLLADGRVNVISLEAVRDRLGARWAFKRDQVYGFTDRVLERGIANGGIYLRVSDTDFFIVHTDLGAFAGQAACLRYLREVLTHFLGDDQMASASVLRVTRIAGGLLEAEPIDLAAAPKLAVIPAVGVGGAGVAQAPAERLNLALEGSDIEIEPAAAPATEAQPLPPAGSALESWTPFV
ncbi:MAG: hypothetical protein ABIU07_10285, partial [Ramlibacter sp.]